MKPQIVFGLSMVVSAIALLVGWRQDPSFERLPSPSMTIFLALFGFIMASLLIFTVNAILALTQGRKARNETELEGITAPALEGREIDDRVLKCTVIPRALVCGACLGALCAVGIQHLTR
jgi:hypothetical protein